MVVDECKVQEEPNPCNRWSETGITPVKRVKRDKRNQISVYGGLSMNTVYITSYFCERQNSLSTIQFLNKVKVRRDRYVLETGLEYPIIIVWDNARWHKSKEIREWLEKNPNTVEMINTPPYSPELNPQEHVWKALKQYLSKRKTHEHVFKEVIQMSRRFLRNRFQYKFF